MKCPHCKGTGDLTGKTIGALIYSARIAAGMTQQELGKKAGGIAYQSIGAWEADAVAPSIRNLAAIATALGCSPKDLIP